jgi:hypothetical protein
MSTFLAAQFVWLLPIQADKRMSISGSSAIIGCWEGVGLGKNDFK